MEGASGFGRIRGQFSEVDRGIARKANRPMSRRIAYPVFSGNKLLSRGVRLFSERLRLLSMGGIP